MEEHYKKLHHLIEKATDAKSVKLEEILTEAVEFFEELRKAYPMASPEEKQELMKMMNRLYLHLQAMSKQLSEKAGMSEETLSNYAENPQNFSPEQWKFLQESKGTLRDSVQKFTALVHEKPALMPKKARTPKAKSPKPRNWA